MAKHGPSTQSTVILMGLFVVATAFIALQAGELTEPLRQPAPEARFGFEPSATGTPTPVDVDRDLIRVGYVAGNRLDARAVRVTVSVDDRRVVLNGERARDHRLTAGERVTVRFVDDRVVARWGTDARRPTWNESVGRPIDVREGDRVAFRVVQRQSNLTVDRLETRA
ncbi:MAG: hypothetical protein ABEJ34_05230 [Haloferacaceae archaeon]